ncbi:TetR/AcrR family transcriptional regulator [Ilumatobacter sp.]|uniref:TetR/AcrR family transcriptional regulator n=1 Tax=Ilumatobacter sp. TaxID=1967498 RepID=UPI003B52D255
MVNPDAPAPRRRGRPPHTKSSETREAILDGARQLFGERGYAAVTNKDLAAAAGITTGALYHYVESKLDLYLLVHSDMQQRIYRRFQVAEASQSTFLAKLQAVLDATHEMNERDPSLARFVGVVRSDLRRHPEVRERLERADAAREQFFVDIVECGVATGEVDPDDVGLLEEFIRLVLVGLTEGTSESAQRQRRAIDSVMALMRGTLVDPDPSGARPPRHHRDGAADDPEEPSRPR